MTQRGFSLMELLVVIVIIGALAGLVYPRISDNLTKNNLRSARQAVTTLHAKARANAIQRGRATALVRNGNEVLIISRHPVTGAIDTIGTPVNIYDSYGGFAMSWSRDSLVFDPRGIGTETSSTTIVVSRAGYADTVVVSSVGSIIE